MKKMFMPFTLAIFTAVASASAFAANPYNNDYCATLGLNGDSEEVKGARYVLAGSTETYRHEGGSLFYKGTAIFDTLNGYAGSDDYSYQDLNFVAKSNINFPSRGSNYVSMTISIPAGEGGPTTLCKNINVQSAPTISKKVLNTKENGAAHAAVDSTYDAFSKAAIEGAGAKYTWHFQRPANGVARPGEIQITSSPEITFHPVFGGTFIVSVTIDDGVYSKSLTLGQVDVKGNGLTPCTCLPEPPLSPL